jgi:hypothetical protein
MALKYVLCPPAMLLPIAIKINCRFSGDQIFIYLLFLAANKSSLED